jgi:hypothetical protein
VLKLKQLTPCSKVLEKAIIPQFVKKYSALYKHRKLNYCDCEYEGYLLIKLLLMAGNESSIPDKESS